MGILESLYAKSPLSIQQAMVSAYGLYWKRFRRGKGYREACEGFRAREQFGEQEWAAYLRNRLVSLLCMAFDSVPHYRETWRQAGLTRTDLANFSLDDLPHLPVLEKSLARDAPLSLLHENIPFAKLRVHHTSGSSGTPVATYWLPREYRQAVALREVRSCGYAGVSYDLPRATFSGRLVVPDPLSPGPFHRYNFFERQVYFSAFHLSGKTVQQYVAALNKHRIRWITGYTHAMYQLACLMLEQGLSAPSVSALITTSEPLTAEKRQIMESAFQAKVFEEYGCVENVLFACECEQGGLHISPDAGIIEIVDERMRPVAPGTPGEVLATGLLRESQPFIRYRLGDCAILARDPCPCGRRLPRLESVVGRMEDLVYGPDGRRVGKFHGLFVNQPHISEAQVIQESLHLIRIRVVAKPGFCEQDRTELIRRLHQRLSDQVQVQVELVDQIEKTAAGKFRAVISKVTALPR